MLVIKIKKYQKRRNNSNNNILLILYYNELELNSGIAFSFVSSTEVSRIERGKANLKFQNARKHLKTPYGVMVL